MRRVCGARSPGHLERGLRAPQTLPSTLSGARGQLCRGRPQAMARATVGRLGWARSPRRGARRPAGLARGRLCGARGSGPEAASAAPPARSVSSPGRLLPWPRRGFYFRFRSSSRRPSRRRDGDGRQLWPPDRRGNGNFGPCLRRRLFRPPPRFCPAFPCLLPPFPPSAVGGGPVPSG